MNLKEFQKIIKVRKVLFKYFKTLKAYGEDLKCITFPVREIERAQIEIEKIYKEK